AEQLNAALLRLLELSPAFHTAAATAADVAGGVCQAAVETFASDAAALWQLEDDGFALLAPPPPPPPSDADRLPLRSAVADALRTPRPSFVADLQEEGDEAWRTRARRTATRSVLRVPLAHGGRVDAVLTLSWRRRVDPPGPSMLALAQRF